MKFPFDGTNYVSSPYGYRYLNGIREWHPGLDIVGLTDKTIHAPCDGTIIASAMYTAPRYSGDRTYEWGNYVALYNASLNVTIYLCHMSARYVKVGDIVKAGSILGREGNTGKSFGSHTHMEFRVNGSAVDPSKFFGFTIAAGQNYEEEYFIEPKKENNDESEDEDLAKVDGKEINERLIAYQKEQKESEWSKNEGSFKKAEDVGAMDGSNPKCYITREQLAAVLDRLGLLK